MSEEDFLLRSALHDKILSSSRLLHDDVSTTSYTRNSLEAWTLLENSQNGFENTVK